MFVSVMFFYLCTLVLCICCLRGIKCLCYIGHFGKSSYRLKFLDSDAVFYILLSLYVY